MIGHELLIDHQLRSQPPDMRQEEPDRLRETGDRAEPGVGLVGMSELVEQAQLEELCAGFGLFVRCDGIRIVVAKEPDQDRSLDCR